MRKNALHLRIPIRTLSVAMARWFPWGGQVKHTTAQ